MATVGTNLWSQSVPGSLPLRPDSICLPNHPLGMSYSLGMGRLSALAAALALAC